MKRKTLGLLMIILFCLMIIIPVIILLKWWAIPFFALTYFMTWLITKGLELIQKD